MEEIVVLKGSSFPAAANTTVHFGAVRGTVIPATATDQLLEVVVPPGATYNNISITNNTNGLTGYSNEQFLLSYSGQHPFNVANLNSQVDFVTGKDMYDACLCDLDNDGKPDYATANKGDENSISLMRNTSTGPGNINFTEINFVIGFPTLHVKCGDLNGDGRQDLVLTPGGSSLRDRLFVLQNNGGWSFTMQSINVNDNKIKTAKTSIADLDLDGKPEIISTNEGTNDIVVLQNTSSLATISFATDPIYFAVPEAATTDGLAVQDLNGDYLPEIVTSQYQTTNSNLYIVENKSVLGTINFGATTKLTVGNTVKRIRIGDLDGDAKPDIAVTQLLGSSVAIFRNTRTGSAISFSSPQVIVADTNPWGLDFGDMDGDGKTDMVVASVTQPIITMLNNTSTPGSISFTKLTINTTFAGRHVRVGDVDGDGKPDISYTGIDATNPAKIGVLRNKSCVTPVISPEKTPIALCTSLLPYKLTATASRGSYFQWLKDGVPVACGINQNTFDVTSGTGSGTYTVKILSEGANCSVNTGCAIESTGIAITIAAGTAANSIPVNNGPVCLGSTLNLSLTTPIGGATYSWTGPNGFTATGTNPSVSNFILANAGTYYVDVTVGGCVATRESTTVEVIDIPSFTIGFTGSSVLCESGPSKTLSVVPAPGTFTYQWLKDGSPVGTGPTFTVTSALASAGSYVVRATNAGCSSNNDSPPVEIDVASLPVAAFTAAATACANQKVLFTNQSTSDASATPVYSWNFDDGQTSTAKDPEHIFTAAGTYDVVLTVSYSGGACPDTETKAITVTAAPAVAITNPENDYTFCEGTSLTLEVAGTFTSYLWSTGATTPSIEISEGGTYFVDVTTTTCTLTATRITEQLDAPEVLVSATPAQINEGESAQLTASGLTAYAWTPVDGLDNPSIATPVASPTQATTYTVTGLGTNGCEGTGEILLRVTGDAIVNKLIPSNFFSPNNDARGEVWEVQHILDFPQCGVVIYDEKGVKVYDAKPYQNDWTGTHNGKALPDGVYFYIIRCDGEEGTPRTGSITLLR